MAFSCYTNIPFLLLYIRSTESFNLVVSLSTGTPDANALIIRHHQSTATALNYGLTVGQAFFGYTVLMDNALRNGNQRPRIVVGSPMLRATSIHRTYTGTQHNPDPKGAVYICNIDLTVLEKESEIKCINSLANLTSPGDFFGGSMSVNSDGHLAVCSPTRIKNCTDVLYTPGYCYTGRNPMEWKPDQYFRSVGCGLQTVDLIFVLDGSSSVDGHFGTIKNFVLNVTSLLQTEDGSINVGVVQYSTYIWQRPTHRINYIKTELELGKFQKFSDFKDAMDKVNMSGGGTMTGAALQKVALDFQKSVRYGKENNKQVMVLLTDGHSKYSKKVREHSEALRNLGIIPYAVGVGKGIDVIELRVIANGNTSDDRVFMVDDFDGLINIVDDLRTEILKVRLEASHLGNATFRMEVGEMGFSISHSRKSSIQVRSQSFSLTNSSEVCILLDCGMNVCWFESHA